MEQPPVPDLSQAYVPPPRKGIPIWVWPIACCGCAIFPVLILAAVLFPVFSQARERARSVSCLSNEKQIALAANMYSQDYDNTLPTSASWMDKLSPYIRREEVYKCPSLGRDTANFGYAFNSKQSGANMDKIEVPRRTVLFYDSSTVTRSASDPIISVPNPPRHLRGNNFAYADGSAKNSMDPAGARPN